MCSTRKQRETARRFPHNAHVDGVLRHITRELCAVEHFMVAQDVVDFPVGRAGHYFSLKYL